MSRITRLALVVGAGFLVLGGAVAAPADTSAKAPPVPTGDFRVSGPAATASDEHPAVTWNETAGEFLVVWEDWRNPARGADIYGRRVSASGQRLGDDFRISGPRATTDDYAPAVAWNPATNEYLVVWQDGRYFGTRGWDIYGRRVSASGSVVGDDFLICGPAATEDDGEAAVAWSTTTGQYLVVWEDERLYATRGADIYGRRVSVHGVPVGSDRRISGAGATRDDRSPALALNPTTNKYLVVWQDGRQMNERGSDIYGRRVRGDGLPIAEDFRISGPAATNSEIAPSVAWNEVNSQYLVVWQDGRKDPAEEDTDIYGHRVRANGAPVGSDFLISSLEWAPDGAPMVAWHQSAERYLVVWADGRDTDTGHGPDIFGRRVRSGGALAGNDFRICSPGATDTEALPAVACRDDAVGCLTVWQDDRNLSSRSWDIYGRIKS